MRKWLLVFAATMAIGVSGCSMIGGVTKDWVISTAKDIAVKAADSQLEKVNEKFIQPQIDKYLAPIEEKLGHKVDVNGDGLWSADELQAAIQEQLKPAIASTVAALTTNTDEKLTDKLKDLATKDDQIKGLIGLFVAWLLAKLGIKVGPKGLQSIKSYMTKPEESTKPNL